MASANNTEAINKLRKVSQLIKYGLTVKMTECAEKNYNKITKNAIDSMARLFPELINDVNDTLNKLILVQKAVKETEQTSQIEDAFVRYLDGPLMNFVKYDVNSGIYALISAFQAMEARRICDDESAKFFLIRAFSAGLLFQFYIILISYLSIDNAFAVNIFRTLYEEKAK